MNRQGSVQEKRPLSLLSSSNLCVYLRESSQSSKGKMSADDNITEEEFHENSKILLWAASVGDNQFCQELLLAGADPDFEDKDNQGNNPLMWAALKAMLNIYIQQDITS